MKTLLLVFALFGPAFIAAAASSAIDVVANGIPANASEVVIVIDSVAPSTAPDYEDPAQAEPPPVLQQLLPVEPSLQPGQEPPQAQKPGQDQPPAQRQGPAQRGRGRRGRAAAATAPPVPSASYRHAVMAKGASSVTVHAEVPAGADYRVRVVAIKGSDLFPTVLAGGKTLGVRVEAGRVTNTSVTLMAPVLKLAPDHPTAVAAGSAFTLAGTLTDPGSFLGTKNRMRVWLSPGVPPAANYEGAQISTVNVTTKEDAVAFSFNLTAPKEPTTLYFQFGEVSPEFVRADGSQAAFLVLPDFSAGANPLQLRVQAAPPANPSAR